MCDSLENRLKKTQKDCFDRWHSAGLALDVERELEQPIFKIEKRGNQYNLTFSCNENIFRLTKETVNMTKAIQNLDLMHKVHMNLRFKSEKLEHIYPIAMSL